MRQNLISTVGTSLLGNIKNSKQDAILQAWNNKQWTLVARELLQIKPADRVCGAEINSIYSIITQKQLSRRGHLFLLVSDTADGENIGHILQSYFESSNCTIRFEKVTVRRVEGLTDEDARRFKSVGLRNLVKIISEIVRNYSSETVAINATGGYKPQISFAGMIGQALELPVYYMFERFTEVISLPPQPVSLNLGLWLEHYELFESLEDTEPLSDEELQTCKPPEAIRDLLDEVVIDGQKYWELTAVGHLFHERSRYYFHRHDTTLSSCHKEETSPEKKKINLPGTHHGNDVLMSFAKKLTQSPYVKEVISSIEYQPRRTKPIKRVHPDGRIEIVMTNTDAGYGLVIQSTGTKKAETRAIAIHLEERFFG